MPQNQEVKGNTLKVYLYLLKNSPSELRDVQHALGFSSASLASYHLGKLIELGFAKQDKYGRYSAVKESADRVLEGYSKIGPAVVPQLFFFSLLFTIVVVFFSMEIWSGNDFTLYLIVICFAMLAVFWFETAKLWRKLAV
ncbi:MAG: hypothetical protein ACPLIG_01980 [Candidatus Bathyarchaeales archaeon]